MNTVFAVGDVVQYVVGAIKTAQGTIRAFVSMDTHEPMAGPCSGHDRVYAVITRGDGEIRRAVALLTLPTASPHDP